MPNPPQKLNALHLDAIAYWHALGDSKATICQRLAEGRHFATEEPTPVEVSVSAIAHRLQTDHVKSRVLHWRRRLFGEMDSPLVFAAERMRRLDKLWDSAFEALRAAQKPAEASAARRDALKVLEAAQRIAEASRAEVTIKAGSEADGRIGEARIASESLDALAEELSRLQAAGLLPGVAPDPGSTPEAT